MASKTHCDVCDAVGATDMLKAEVSVPGKPHWDRSRLNVSIVVQGERYSDGEPAGRKDVCVDCRKKLVADALGLRTADEYNALRDELQAVIDVCRAELAAARAEKADLTVTCEAPVPDNDIPF
jgi:hypothetical protein